MKIFGFKIVFGWSEPFFFRFHKRKVRDRIIKQTKQSNNNNQITKN